jgi:hypothetical protein
MKEFHCSEWTFVSVCGLCATSRKVCVQVNAEKINVFMCPHQHVGLNPYLNINLNINRGRLYDKVMQGYTNSRYQDAQVTVFGWWCLIFVGCHYVTYFISHF